MSKNDEKNVDNTYSGSVLDDLLNNLSGRKGEDKPAKKPKAEEKKSIKKPPQSVSEEKPSQPKNEELHAGHRERLRKKFTDTMSFEGLSDHEILELLLFYVIPRADTNALAHKLIKKFGGFTKVLNAPFSELLACSGLNEQSAAYLKMLMRLCAKYNVEMQQQISVSNAESLEDYMLYQFAGESDECSKLFLVDAKGRLSAPHEIGRGLEEKSVFNFKKAINIIVNSSESYVMLAHNHLPKEHKLSKKPTENDVIITRRFKQMLEPIGVTLIDHFVVTGNEVISMRALGLIDI